MIDFNSQYIGFVVACYAISALMLLGLVNFVFGSLWQRRKALAKLEAGRSQQKKSVGSRI